MSIENRVKTLEKKMKGNHSYIGFLYCLERKLYWKLLSAMALAKSQKRS